MNLRILICLLLIPLAIGMYTAVPDPVYVLSAAPEISAPVVEVTPVPTTEPIKEVKPEAPQVKKENKPAVKKETKPVAKKENTLASRGGRRELVVSATAYHVGTITSRGTRPTVGRTVAVDPMVIPYGSGLELYWNGKCLGRNYIAEDCGPAIKGNEIDIYWDSVRGALQFGRQKVTVVIK